MTANQWKQVQQLQTDFYRLHLGVKNSICTAMVLAEVGGQGKGLAGPVALQSLAPGKEPWKALIRYRLEQATVVPGAARDWLWALTENPSLHGLRSASSL